MPAQVLPAGTAMRPVTLPPAAFLTVKLTDLLSFAESFLKPTLLGS